MSGSAPQIEWNRGSVQYSGEDVVKGDYRFSVSFSQADTESDYNASLTAAKVDPFSTPSSSFAFAVNPVKLDKRLSVVEVQAKLQTLLDAVYCIAPSGSTP